MAIKWTKGGGTDMVDGEILPADDWNDTFDATTTIRQINLFKPEGTSPIIFDADKWQTTTHDSTDEGLTWVANGGKAVTTYRAVSRENSSYAFSINAGGAAPVYTTDKGANWNAPAAAPANLNAVYGIDYPSNSKCVITGNSTNGNPGVWFSNDSGNNWTQATTGPNDGAGNDTAYSLSMYDDSNGFLVGLSVANYDVYQTTNGAVDWTSVSGGVHAKSSYILNAISSTKWAYVRGDVYGQNPTMYGGWEDIAGGGTSGELKIGSISSGNGDRYTVYLGGCSIHASQYPNLLKTDDENLYIPVWYYYSHTHNAAVAASSQTFPIGVMIKGSNEGAEWGVWATPHQNAYAGTHSHNMVMSGDKIVNLTESAWFYD